ncbi:type II secretion system protein GspI [Pseudomonas alkylphenolica]|uniref:Type II secretion system protein I n=2 Tax=Pseudomonas alkylphenolica TaxID=237609 RepID=A0A6I6HDJ9_9PSED|nr:type II secretion system protein GspI [Pseudomonas alkylphenolica]
MTCTAMAKQEGFTLLEVLIALAVFALLSTTVVSASGYVVFQQTGLHERLLAAWLVDNHLTELSLNPRKSASQSVTRRMGEREWTLHETWRDTGDAGLTWVEVSVVLSDSEQVLASNHLGFQADTHEH